MRRLPALLFVFILFDLEAISAEESGPIVETNLGKIRGTRMKTEKGAEFSAFRGIRYAEAPTSDKRFKAPVAIKKWSGELDATRDGFMCPQVGKPLHLLSEDCLILNVYTKNSSAANLPVIVFIHGGANIYGGSHSVETAGPEYLMESDIIFVSINYRLGALGFVSTRTKEAPGNFGYLDQVMALEWVHDHISKFGGNPKSVTLLGLSAGSVAITLHLASPRSQGLFHRVIAMSGSALGNYNFNNLYWTQKLARECSCPLYNPVNILDCLRKLSWQRIVAITESWNLYNLTDLKFSFEIDGYFLTRDPTLTFAEGNFSKVPIMTGLTRDEFTFMVNIHENNSGLLNDISLNFRKYAHGFFIYNLADPQIDEIRSFYLENEAISKKNLKNFGDIFSDSLANHATHRLVELARKYVDVFYYRFDFMGSYGIFENWHGKPLGVNHGDDLQYIIKRKTLRKRLGPNDAEWFMVERMVRVVSTFAQNGVPTHIDGVQWLPSNKTHVNTLYIKNSVKLGAEPVKRRVLFWDSLYPVEQSGAILK